MKGWRRRSRASVVRAGAAGVTGMAEGVQKGRDGSLPGASDRSGRVRNRANKSCGSAIRFDGGLAAVLFGIDLAGRPVHWRIVNTAGWNGLTE
jgi:hypothetical protein